MGCSLRLASASWQAVECSHGRLTGKGAAPILHHALREYVAPWSIPTCYTAPLPLKNAVVSEFPHQEHREHHFGIGKIWANETGGAAGSTPYSAASAHDCLLVNDRTTAFITGGQTPLPRSLMRSLRVPWGNLKSLPNPIARCNSGT